MASLRFVCESEKDVHVRVRPSATGGVAVPADIEAVWSISLIKQGPCLSQEGERLLYLVGREVKDCQAVFPRDDHAAPSEEIAVEILGVHKEAMVALNRRDDAPGTE